MDPDLVRGYMLLFDMAMPWEYREACTRIWDASRRQDVRLSITSRTLISANSGQSPGRAFRHPGIACVSCGLIVVIALSTAVHGNLLSTTLGPLSTRPDPTKRREFHPVPFPCEFRSIPRNNVTDTNFGPQQPSSSPIKAKWPTWESQSSCFTRRWVMWLRAN